MKSWRLERLKLGKDDLIQRERKRWKEEGEGGERKKKENGIRKVSVEGGELPAIRLRT